MGLVELGRAADYLARCDIEFIVEPKLMMITARDTNKVSHQYYVDNQRAIFYKGAEFGSECRAVDNIPLNKFAYVCKHPEVLTW